jgi:hypothetical protein
MKTTTLERDAEVILRNLSLLCHKGNKAKLSHSYNGEIHTCDALFSRLDYENKSLVIDHVDMAFYKELNDKELITIYIEGARKALLFKENLKAAFVGKPIGYQQVIFEVPDVMEVFDKRKDPRIGFNPADNIMAQIRDGEILRSFNLSDLSLGGFSLSLTDHEDVSYFPIEKELSIQSIGGLCFLVPIKTKVVHRTVGKGPFSTIHLEFSRKLDQFSNYSLDKLVSLIKR